MSEEPTTEQLHSAFDQTRPELAKVLDCEPSQVTLETPCRDLHLMDRWQLAEVVGFELKVDPPVEQMLLAVTMGELITLALRAEPKVSGAGEKRLRPVPLVPILRRRGAKGVEGVWLGKELFVTHFEKITHRNRRGTFVADRYYMYFVMELQCASCQRATVNSCRYLQEFTFHSFHDTPSTKRVVENLKRLPLPRGLSSQSLLDDKDEYSRHAVIDYTEGLLPRFEIYDHLTNGFSVPDKDFGEADFAAVFADLEKVIYSGRYTFGPHEKTWACPHCSHENDHPVTPGVVERIFDWITGRG